MTFVHYPTCSPDSAGVPNIKEEQGLYLPYRAVVRAVEANVCKSLKVLTVKRH